METQFNIVISIKTPEGMQEIGNFLIGEDEDMALSTFNNLSGYDDGDTKSVLRVELIKKTLDTPAQSLAAISCTLDQYAENCRIIVRDAFKYFTLER